LDREANANQARHRIRALSGRFPPGRLGIASVLADNVGYGDLGAYGGGCLYTWIDIDDHHRARTVVCELLLTNNARRAMFVCCLLALRSGSILSRRLDLAPPTPKPSPRSQRNRSAQILYEIPATPFTTKWIGF
jgi:hypothetical protein